MYYIIEYADPDETGEQSLETNLPETQSYLVLLSTSWGSGAWAVASLGEGLDEEEESRHNLERVSNRLFRLIASGEHYPPALALARDEAEHHAEKRPDGRIDRAVLLDAYAERIQHHLARQKHAPYMMAEAVGDEIGYLMRGAYYWVLEYSPSAETVRWVSDDYHVYPNPGVDFALAESDKVALTWVRKKH